MKIIVLNESFSVGLLCLVCAVFLHWFYLHFRHSNKYDLWHWETRLRIVLAYFMSFLLIAIGLFSFLSDML